MISWAYSLVTLLGLLINVASLVVKQRLYGMQASVVVAQGLRSCSTWVLQYRLSSCGTQA